jgi:SPP1 family predicted phage head-tail adaptor
MRVGKLRHRLIIQKVAETQDTSGGIVSTWTTFARVWGSIEPLRGREFFAAREKQSRIDTRIRIRYLEGINPKMRIIWEDHTYEILAILDIEMAHKEMQLMCYEIAGVD